MLANIPHTPLPKEVLSWLIINEKYIFIKILYIVLTIIIFFIGNFVSKKLTVYSEKIFQYKKVDHVVVTFICSFVRYATMFLICICCLAILGIQTTSVIAILGSIGITLGLAVQGSLSNLAAGVLLITLRPFKTHDYVELDSKSGSVVKIQLFYTTLITADNKTVIIPNSNIIAEPMINYSANPTRRIDFVIGVGYDADLAHTKKILEQIMQEDDRVLKDHKIVVGVESLGDSAVNIVVRPWVKTADYWSTYFDLLEKIKVTLDNEKINIPFPQMDIHVKDK